MPVGERPTRAAALIGVCALVFAAPLFAEDYVQTACPANHSLSIQTTQPGISFESHWQSHTLAWSFVDHSFGDPTSAKLAAWQVVTGGESAFQAAEVALAAFNALEALAEESQANIGANAIHPARRLTLVEEMVCDYEAFCTPQTAVHLIPAVALGCTLAHSDMDARIRDGWQQRHRSDATNYVSRNAKMLGEGQFMVPLTVLTYCIAEASCYEYDDSPLRDWSRGATRAYLFGGPTLLAAQLMTGGSRPGEELHGSSWDPLGDDNGVSGHAFIGAVPFLTAAHLTENRMGKALFWGASLLAPLSRVNDDQHYLSQAIMGWGMAYAATRMTTLGGDGQRWNAMVPYSSSEGVGVAYIVAF